MNEVDCGEQWALPVSPGVIPRTSTENHSLKKGLPLQLSGSWTIRKTLLAHLVPESHHLGYGLELEAATSIGTTEPDHTD